MHVSLSWGPEISAMPAPDRRTTHRYPSDCLVSLGWWQGKEFCTRPAQLRDISSGGAMVTVEEGSPAQSQVWFCLVGQDKPHWMSAEVLEVMSEPEGNHSIRLRFPDSCLYEIFKSAVWGSRTKKPTTLSSASSGAPAVQDSSNSPTAQAPDPASDRLDPKALFAETAPDPLRESTSAVSSRPACASQPRTLVQAHREDLLLRDRMAALPWLVRWAICLLIIFMLGSLARGQLEVFDKLGMVFR